jgi:hypothetical protein
MEQPVLVSAHVLLDLPTGPSLGSAGPAQDVSRCFCRTDFFVQFLVRASRHAGLVFSSLIFSFGLHHAKSTRLPLMFLSVRGRRSRGWFLDSSVPLGFSSVTAPKALQLSGSVFLVSTITVQAKFA